MSESDTWCNAETSGGIHLCDKRPEHDGPHVCGCSLNWNAA